MEPQKLRSQCNPISPPPEPLCPYVSLTFPPSSALSPSVSLSSSHSASFAPADTHDGVALAPKLHSDALADPARGTGDHRYALRLEQNEERLRVGMEQMERKREAEQAEDVLREQLASAVAEHQARLGKVRVPVSCCTEYASVFAPAWAVLC